MRFSEIWNTPGYFYGVGYALTTIAVLRFQRPAVRGWRRWLAGAALLAGLVTFMTLTNGAQGGYFVTVMATVVAAIYAAVFFTVRDARHAGFYCAKAFIYGEFSASLCWQVYYYMALKWERLQGLGPQIAAMCVLFAAILGAVYLLERSLYGDLPEPDVTRRDLIVIVLMALSVYIVSNLGYLDPGGLFSGSFARDVFAIRTLADLCGVAMIYAFHSQLIEVQLRLEKEALQNIMQLQYQAYQISRENIEMVNEKYHDLKHQIALLRAQGTSEKSEAYLQRMEQEIRSYEAQNRTGNPVLDAILTNKSQYCRNHGIELKFIADGKLLDFMDDMELSALFGNMLDNAIEGVERVADPEKRLIRLYVAGEKQFLRIRMENYCEEKIRFQDGMPVTTKRDAKNHGFGMKSMQRTVSRYGGSMLASLENNWFELKILIPMSGA